MPKEINLEKIIANNLLISKDIFYEETKELKQVAIKEEGYNILSPFSTKPRIRALDEIEKNIIFASSPKQ